MRLTFCRLKYINLIFPFLNQETEHKCLAVKEIRAEIERQTKTRKRVERIHDFEDNRQYYKVIYGCKVEDMKAFILSDLCLNLHEKAIPTIKRCRHSGPDRYSGILCRTVLKLFQNSHPFGTRTLQVELLVGTRIGAVC